MAWNDRSAHDWLSHAGCEMAGTGSSIPVSGRHATGAAHTHVAAKLPDCMGAQSACISRRNHAVPHNLERTLQRMKKILLTLFQIAVTVGMLIWVFLHPKKGGTIARQTRTPRSHR